MKESGVPLITISFTSKRYNDRKIEMNRVCKGQRLKVYRSLKTKNRNLDSIVIYVKTEDKCVLLSGDQRYDKLHDYIILDDFPKVPLIFVMPHHGGYAGHFKKSDWDKILPIESIVISYHDSNNYGHPFETNVRTAERLVSPNNVFRTNGSGDKYYLI
ncbi:hypothetical protein [Bacillus marinisedimentorum]|uniref:hypothetical protein n=1 Tax=Bacillus marinisedimentorum TaxID=1821260 RepID=UPI0007E2019D|nr:hypothetical protein [Bacillus marinisedimentorum]